MEAENDSGSDGFSGVKKSAVCSVCGTVPITSASAVSRTWTCYGLPIVRAASSRPTLVVNYSTCDAYALVVVRTCLGRQEASASVRHRLGSVSVQLSTTAEFHYSDFAASAGAREPFFNKEMKVKNQLLGLPCNNVLLRFSHHP